MPTSEDCEADVWGPRVGEGQSDRAGGGGVVQPAF